MNHTELKQLKKLLVDRVHDEDLEIKVHAQNLYDHIYITLKERDLLHVDHSKELKHLSLCTGYGGLDLALKRGLRKIRAVCYVEIEAFALYNLVEKIEAGFLDAAPIWTDLKTFDWEAFNGRVDIISGGFPCQPFSSAGRRAGDEDPRHLWPYIKDGIKRLGRPPLVFLENVEGIIASKLKGDGWSDPEGTPVLLHVLRELERLGYEATAGVFSACEVGAPHQRKRVFILGVRSDLGQSGRDIISTMLRKHAGPTMGHPEKCNLKSARGGRGPQKTSVLAQIRESSTAYPAPRGAEQFAWEPPRITAEIKSAVGRGFDGPADRLGYAQLSKCLDSRTDELRLLGNGVVPDAAEKAFRILWDALEYSPV